MKQIVYWAFFYFRCGFGAVRSWELAERVMGAIRDKMAGG